MQHDENITQNNKRLLIIAKQVSQEVITHYNMIIHANGEEAIKDLHGLYLRNICSQQSSRYKGMAPNDFALFLEDYKSVIIMENGNVIYQVLMIL